MTSTRTGRIRLAEQADLAGLVLLENEAFESDRLDRRALRHAIGSSSIVSLVAEGPKRDLAGYALVQLRRGSTIGRLTSLAVARNAARRGVGRSLVTAAEKAAREAGCTSLRLEVRTDNAPARTLYEATGFHRTDTIEDYYEDGAAASCYLKGLDGRA